MELNPHDQEIIRLLGKLKDVPAEYPENMFAAQRQGFLKRMGEIELGISGGSRSSSPTAHTKPSLLSSATGTVLETAIIATIVAEAGVMAYFYREKLSHFVENITAGPRAEALTPVLPTSVQIQGVSPSPPSAATTVTATPTGIMMTGTGTPIPAAADDQNGTPGLASTPDPNGNNGNHYGQTPKPERTKENNGENDKPPKSTKPPKVKPTKSK